MTRLRAAWQRAIDTLGDGGESPRFVLGVSRAIDPRLTPPTRASDPISVHPTDDAHVAVIIAHILRIVAMEASTCLAEGVVVSQAEAELRAIEAGYPFHTGGPIHYLGSTAGANRPADADVALA